MFIRKDTVDRSTDKPIIEFERQNLIGVLGRRGSGKSMLAEAVLERYFDNGYTCLDLWSAPNMENAFWIFAKEGHRKRIPITILAPESFIYPEARVDAFNGKFPHVRELLVKFVKLPSPTKRSESEVNEKILEILVQAIRECRDSRRILVFNPYMFPNEVEMFRVLEILMRNLITIANKHFTAKKPQDVGKTTKEQMTDIEKSYHKLVFLIREFGEVAPARLKGDKSGESTLIKKALLQFVRLARHANIDGIIDYQNASDAESAIRNQIDIWFIKTWTRELGGEHFQWVFDYVDNKRDRIFEEEGFNDESFQWADSIYPPIEKLSKQWFYVAKSGDSPRLIRVPELGVKHKEPNDKWWLMTNIPLEWDKEALQKESTTTSMKDSKTAGKMAFLTIKQMMAKKRMKRAEWITLIPELSEKQKKGEITFHIDLSTAKINTISKWFNRMKKEYELVEQ